MKRILAAVLAAALLLTGCTGMKDIWGYGGDYTSYEEMVYTRPDMEALERTLERCCETGSQSTSLDEVVDAVYLYYDIYDQFYTNYNLAYIKYARDMTSARWEEEYNFCAENAPLVDAGLEELYMSMAGSPIRDKLEGDDYFGAGFFDAYEGEATYDEGFLALMEEEAALLSSYYDLSAEAETVEYYSEAYFDGYADELCQALIDLVLLRREIAEYMGYDSYVDFAWDFYYYRDYTPVQAMAYMNEIQTEMAELYRETCASDVWDGGYGFCTEGEMMNYLRSAVDSMGGTVEEAFRLMESAGLYDITYSDKKYNSSFELYLTSYYEPYVFVNPSGYDYDKLTLAHEFGHFSADYACYGGSYAGIDVQEVFSQGMEYLCLFYDDGLEALEKYKLGDCLSTYVEQSAYACFEMKLYGMAESELTVENVYRLYEDTCRGFGIDFETLGWDTRDLVTVPHFYSDPMYIISYVVSNDAAFQIFQMELEDRGSGLDAYEQSLTTECYYFLEFVGEAGLESPFAPGRVGRVRDDLEELLR